MGLMSLFLSLDENKSEGETIDLFHIHIHIYHQQPYLVFHFPF